MEKAYDPKKTEEKTYRLWEESGFFNPDNLPGKRKKSYSVVIPPPNITGELHMGHALNAVAQDVLVRWRRMQGFKTLWLPGTDHAGIAAQNVVEKWLKREEGKTRFDLGQEKFIERVWEWKKKYGDIILEQLKKIGASCDWSRTRFTMDREYKKAVESAFLRYRKKGWIYQGKRVVNWCPRCLTSLSDLELEYREEKSHLWFIRYLLAESPKDKNSGLVVATTRPETMLGDTAVAVGCKDKRYQHLIGKKLILPLVNKEIPVVCDPLIDPEFGTGALKVTPAHDLTDQEIGRRHKLESVQVIDEKGRMAENAPLPYRGMGAGEAREKIVAHLKESGFLEKTEDYVHQVPKCYRCQTTVELIPSRQWFLKMDRLAKTATKAVKSGKVRFVPEGFKKIYFDWLKNIKDWCISRQLWWGHKIPIEGETDVLDTWFSSALWPFATLGWPEKTKDLKSFYPTDVLSTARDIINLWVARMVFSGKEFTGKSPFHTVFIHPTVLTKEGRRMSKSLGTGIDPIGLIEKYGADATRFGIAFQMTGSQDLRFTEDNIVMGKKFCNKIWNAARFVLLRTPDGQYRMPEKPRGDTAADKKIIKALGETAGSVSRSLENFQFGKAAHDLYDFFWHDFCDEYIEETKKQNDEKTKELLLWILLASLKLLHPLIPFLTEEIYQQMPIKEKKKCLMVENWPKLK